MSVWQYVGLASDRVICLLGQNGKQSGKQSFQSDGEARGTRTHNLLIKSQLLYQLS
jgi:hypothetical protein